MAQLFLKIEADKKIYSWTSSEYVVNFFLHNIQGDCVRVYNISKKPAIFQSIFSKTAPIEFENAFFVA